MLAVALALGSTVAWGVSDFLGGLAGRRMQLLVVLAVSQATGLVLALAIVPVAHGPLPGGDAALLAVASGVADVIALWALYRGLSDGAMSVVAPIAATGAAVPVGYGVIVGEPLSGAIVAGAGLAVAGIALVSREEDGGEEPGTRRGVWLGLLAALGFGIGFVALGAASESEVGWSVVLNRAGSLGTVVLVVLWRLPKLRVAYREFPELGTGALVVAWPRLGVARRDLPSLALIGALDACAITLFAWASTHGPLGVVAALGSLYPVVTIALARVFDGERLGAVRRIGALAAASGAMLLAVATNAGGVSAPDEATASTRPAPVALPALVPVEKLAERR